MILFEFINSYSLFIWFDTIISGFEGVFEDLKIIAVLQIKPKLGSGLEKNRKPESCVRCNRSFSIYNLTDSHGRNIDLSRKGLDRKGIWIHKFFFQNLPGMNRIYFFHIKFLSDSLQFQPNTHHHLENQNRFSIVGLWKWNRNPFYLLTRHEVDSLVEYVNRLHLLLNQSSKVSYRSIFGVQEGISWKKNDSKDSPFPYFQMILSFLPKYIEIRYTVNLFFNPQGANS